MILYIIIPIITAIISATGDENQTPYIPNNLGNIIIVEIKKTKVLKKAIIADIFPFPNAVNNAAKKTVNPIGKNVNIYITKHCFVNANTSGLAL